MGNITLVGGLTPSEKYESTGMMKIPSMWKNKSYVPVTTNQNILEHHSPSILESKNEKEIVLRNPLKTIVKTIVGT